MKIHTKAVHAGDRKKAGAHVPVTTPIYTASSYFYDSMEQLDRVFGHEEPGYCYARYDNPTMPRWKNWWRRSKAATARWRAAPAWRRSTWRCSRR